MNSRAIIESMELWDDDEDMSRYHGDGTEVDSAEAGEMESFACAYCGEENELFIDRTSGKRQQFTEDCDVCCGPNLVTVFIDPDGGVWIEAEREEEA